MRLCTLWLVLLSLVLGHIRTLSAQTIPAAPASQPAATEPLPHEVYTGVYINQIKSIDLKTNTFVVDFWVWFRWKGDDIKPLDTFEVVGGQVDGKTGEIHEVVKGWNYAACRATATMTKFFDIRRFPLDEHVLALAIEDSEMETERLVYHPDVDNSGLSPEVAVPGWKIDSSGAKVVDQQYATNYGNISLDTGNKSIYSRFVFEVSLTRPGAGYFFKLFWSLFLATIIALLALLIDPIDLDPRFGLGVGAIFAAIASAYVISSALPETNQYTLADKMNMLAVAVIFLSIVESVLSLRLWKNGKEALSRTVDRVSFCAMLTLYGIATLWMVFV
jgi:hypothetical protein